MVGAMRLDAKRISGDPVDDPMAFYGLLENILAGGNRVALCTVLRLTGSGPRRAGAKMLVPEAGETVGTVGGGVLEWESVALAREALATGRALLRSVALDLQHASDEGMTCGGQVDVLVEPFDAGGGSAREFFAKTAALLASDERGWQATAITSDGGHVVTEHFLVAGGAPVASLSPRSGNLPENLLRAPAPMTPAFVEQGSVRYFLDPLAPPITVYVFGAGHIGLHLVPLCHRLGFRTVVVDDRADFVSRDRFPEADDLVAVPSFEHTLGSFPIGERTYIVIATRGHGGDQTLLRQALRRRPGYVGMIGSKRKRGLIYEQLAGEGFTPDDLSRVHCPIGLPIGAATPEEIAVSIAADLIATRAGKGGGE